MEEISSKAVRDNIPEIIGASGRKYTFKEVSDSVFLQALENKLNEEVKEYLESKDIEELVDLLEVIYRIAELRGFSKNDLEALRLQKKSSKGGFNKNLLLFKSFEEKCSHLDLESIDSVDVFESIDLIASFNPSNLVNSINSVEPSNPEPVVFRSENAEIIEKHGVQMKIYTSRADCKNAAVLYQETGKGHSEEFLHEKSDFIYYILEGTGTWVIKDREFEVKTGDVLIVPAGNRFWFHGNLKQICITAPAWEEKYEHHIRNIKL